VITHLAAFLGVSALVIVTPGQDTALTIRNTLVAGRRGGVATACGVSSGQAVWAIATAAGVAAVLRASEPVFHALRIAGAAYLVVLGAHALYAAARPQTEGMPPRGRSRRRAARASYRQGFLSNLGNPKMAIFFTSLLPQFVADRNGSFPALLVLGLVFCGLTVTWLIAYAFAVARAGDVLRRPRIRRALDALIGATLVAFGLRLAVEKA
jgi:threonine/homoserine/homoserine lactone efflux protein